MKQYAIHPDYQSLRIGDASFGRGFMIAVNGLIKAQNLFRKPRADVEYSKHYAISSDGNKVKLELIRPKNQRPSRCVVHYSGGAFCVGPQASHYDKAELYAINAQCTVVFVTYSLAPKHPFPAGLNDCVAALEWTQANAGAEGLDVNNIIVMGDSAGGFMAAAVPQVAKDKLTIKPKAQLLIYPVTDASCSSQSATEFTAVPVFSGKANRAMWEAYLADLDRKQLPAYASPIERKDMQGLPPAYVETAEFDPLRDEGIAYAERLQAAGVDVEVNNTKGTVHGFDIYAKNTIYSEAINRRYGFLNRVFERE